MLENAFKPKMLERQKLQKLLLRSRQKPLVYLYGLMGSGKTTSVEMYLKKSGGPPAIWFTCPDEVMDEQWAWGRFVQTLGQRLPELASALSEAGIPQSSSDVGRIMDILTQQLSQDILLVIDDFHLVQNLHLKHLAAIIAKEQPQNLRLILISRNPPEPVYYELEIKGRCTIIGQESLNFTAGEIQIFYRQNGFPLEGEAVRKLNAYCGGWTATVYLSLLQYAETHRLDAIDKAEKFVWTAICEKMGQAEQKILVQLSQLNTFTLEQASFVTGAPEAAAVVQQMLRKNCFIHYHTQSRTYQLHTILKNVVNQQNLLSQAEIQELNRQNGVWYQRQEKPLEAINAYRRAGNDDAILEIMEQKGATELLDQAPSLIIESFKAIPPWKRLSHPRAYLSFLCSYLVVVDAERALELLEEAKTVYRKNPNLPNKKRILGEIALIESYAVFNDLEEMSIRHRQAYEAFEGGESQIQCSQMDFTFGCPSILYLYHSRFGGLRQILDRLKKDGWYYTHVSGGCGAGHEYILEAEYAMGLGQWFEAQNAIEKAQIKAEEKKQKSILISALFQQMRLELYLGDEKKIRSCRKKMEEAAANSDIPSQRQSAEIALGFVSAVMGRSDEIPVWLKKGDTEYYTAPPQGKGIIAIVHGMAEILENNPIKLEIHAELLLEHSRRNHFIIGEIYARLFKAIAVEQQRGDGAPILKSLLSDMRPDEYYSPLIELSPHVLAMLCRLKPEDAEPVLEDCRHFNDLYENYHGICAAGLTVREKEILTLLCRGYARKQIGTELKIGLPTVKTHIRNIYNKLQVSKKADAIKKAEKLSLI